MASRAGILFGLVAAVTLMHGCGDPVGPKKPDPITQLPRALTDAEQSVIRTANVFGFHLLEEVDGERTTDQPNTIISPLSASMALGMAMEGAAGETFTEMRDVLGFEGMEREDINASYEGLMDLLLTLDPAVEIELANSAWSRLGFPFEASYFNVLTTSFDAMVQELDFGDPAAKETINQWVRDRTNDRIEEIIDVINPEDILFLLNAVYFKGDWTTQFKKNKTQPAPFYMEDGSTIQVSTMHGDIDDVGFAWLEGGRTIAELPYGGQAFGMVLVLPGQNESVEDLIGAVDEATWAIWMDALTISDEVALALPTFELEWDGMFNPALERMGMPKAFDPFHADFSRMTPAADAHISAVRQKTYMRVDEEGTEAAAVTSVTIGVTSAGPGLMVDRPFLLAIRERLSGTILFLGAVRDPR